MIGARTTRGMFLCGVAILCSGIASAQCHPPHFRKGRDFLRSVYISIAPRDFTLSKLVCTAQSLRDRRKLGADFFFVLFFTSYKAAVYFQPPIEGYPPYWPQSGQQLHAVYSFDAHKGEETLNIAPLGYFSTPSQDTTITLPLSGPPHCNLRIQNRCLMAVVQPVTYPVEALQTKTSGDVTLTAQANSGGRVTNVKVTAANANPQGHGDALASAAIQNLKAWQFDAGVALRIRFSYVIDSSLRSGMDTDVEWDLPDRVVIRGKPPK